jgi:O-glycosyl hydrolase
MTVSGSVTGSTNGSDNNLRADCETQFADYLATVVSNLTMLDGVKFDTVTPMNEPRANWWKLGNRQEGAHMNASQQARMIKQLRVALDRNGVQATIVASEDNDERSTCDSVAAYDTAALGDISHIVTHTYNANDPRRLRRLAKAAHKPLWVSEYGDGERTGLALARRIRDDITDLHASAWIYWQFVDRGGWGLVANALNGHDETCQLTRKFHVMAQFSRFIRPGCQILGANDSDSLVAYDRTNGRLIIVAVNDHATENAITYNLNGFETSSSEVLPHRTSYTERVTAMKPLNIEHGKFTATLPAQSVTTFEISNVKLDPTKR